MAGVCISQGRKSDFFNYPKQDKYKVVLYLESQGSKNTIAYPLDADDTRRMIDVFARQQYVWATGLNMHDMRELNMYGYYVHTYWIKITHPNGKHVNIPVNAGGLLNKQFYISKNSEFDITDDLSREDAGIIKELFLKNIPDFGNITPIAGERICITPNLPSNAGNLPPVYLNDEDTRKFLALYNSGFNAAYVGRGGDPLPSPVPLYTVTYNNKELFRYDNVWLLSPSQAIEFLEEKQDTISALINKALTTFNGEYEVKLNDGNKGFYTYKDGLPNGLCKIYNPQGRLIRTESYLQGNIIYTEEYNEDGSRSEFHYTNQRLSWLNGSSYRVYWIHYNIAGYITEEGVSRTNDFTDRYYIYRDFDYRRQLRNGQAPLIEIKNPLTGKIERIGEKIYLPLY